MVTKWYADRVHTFVTIADVLHPPKYTPPPKKMEVYVAGRERPTHEVTAIKKRQQQQQQQNIIINNNNNTKEDF